MKDQCVPGYRGFKFTLHVFLSACTWYHNMKKLYDLSMFALGVPLSFSGVANFY